VDVAAHALRVQSRYAFKNELLSTKLKGGIEGQLSENNMKEVMTKFKRDNQSGSVSNSTLNRAAVRLNKHMESVGWRKSVSNRSSYFNQKSSKANHKPLRNGRD
jgi:hypothetical protein